MRGLLVAILSAVALVAVVTGCGGAHRYDGRLVAADSLMHDLPDSALALVQAVSADSLPVEADRAYRDLLLTQARYRCYVTATSDSAINRALSYYRAHDGEREKLTRCYIYKGAVMEELGHPDSAMYYYKHAEATAAPDDYFNLGYVKMRMGALYRDNFSIDGKSIEKYQEAFAELSHTDEHHSRLGCLINLGALYKLKMPEKSESILVSAATYALSVGDSSRYFQCLKTLSQTYYILKKYHAAHETIQKVLGMTQYPHDDMEFCANAADVYSRLGILDSAELFLEKATAKPFTSIIDEMMLNESIGEIALARGDSATYLKMDMRNQHMQDSIQRLDATLKISQVEDSHNQLTLQQGRIKHRRTGLWLITSVVILLGSLIALCYLHYWRIHRYDRLIADLRGATSTHIRELDDLQCRIKELDIRDSKLNDFINSQIVLFREVIEQCYKIPNTNLVKQFREVLTYQENNKEKWGALNEYIDMRYHHFLSDTLKHYPQLNERDTMLIALTIMDFSCAQIAMVMGYANPSSIGPLRQRVAKKMGLECTLKQYIDCHIKS